MTPYVGCEYARERLEALLDNELSVDEQVLVESHVRWCRTCADRIEDFQLIGTSIRVGPSNIRMKEVEPALSAVYSRVLMRMRAEHDQAFTVRMKELFIDMRLLWPALGATMAVLVCLSVALGVLKSTSSERPQSLATRLEAMNPGSESNPLRPDNNSRVDRYFDKFVDSDRAGGITIPRVMDDGASVAGIQDEEATFTMAMVVNREGRITTAELLNSERGVPSKTERVLFTNEAVLDAVRQSRFAPAQTPIGRTVAVNMVWLIVVTTVQTPDPQTAVQVAPVVARTRRLPPADPAVPLPVGRQSSRLGGSPTA
ncbi:MAG TPA: zf-HC2 domain-containing protein [Vicinamibacterales bacterium]|nr:zf-HC2 domain-containing protein [Vicinamibacterales bacterium]